MEKIDYTKNSDNGMSDEDIIRKFISQLNIDECEGYRCTLKIKNRTIKINHACFCFIE